VVSRLRKVAEKGSGPEGYRRLLRWAALPITDRRWAAPLSAVALGFGLFVGVAIGPGATGTFATGAAQIIEIPGFGASGDSGEEEESEEPAIAEAPEPSGLGVEKEASPSGIVPIAPLAEEPLESTGEESPGKAPAGEGEKEPTEPDEQQLAGTVVHVNTAASSYTVVEPGGLMTAVHAGKLPAAGAQVEVPIETLANGTLGEVGKRVETGQRPQATLAGIVTAVDPTPSAPSYAVSNRGTSVLIHVHPDASGATPSLPAVGVYTTVVVEIEALPAAASSSRKRGGAAASALAEPPVTEPPPSEAPPSEEQPPAEAPPSVMAPPQPAPPSPPAVAPVPPCVPDPALVPLHAEPQSVLWQRRASGAGAPFTHSDFAGVVMAVCPATSQLLISADDTRESGHELLFAVPASIDPSKFEPGQSVLLAADIASDGTLTLTGLASNQRLKGADDARAVQGDLASSKAKGAAVSRLALALPSR
jgi:hypothetical protein